MVLRYLPKQRARAGLALRAPELMVSSLTALRTQRRPGPNRPRSEAQLTEHSRRRQQAPDQDDGHQFTTGHCTLTLHPYRASRGDDTRLPAITSSAQAPWTRGPGRALTGRRSRALGTRGRGARRLCDATGTTGRRSHDWKVPTLASNTSRAALRCGLDSVMRRCRRSQPPYDISSRA